MGYGSSQKEKNQRCSSLALPVVAGLDYARHDPFKEVLSTGKARSALHPLVFFFPRTAHMGYGSS